MAGAIKWIASQLHRLSEAVRKYNAAITRMENSGQYDYVPNRTSVEKEKKHIRTRHQLYRREKQLGRVLKSNNPEATKQVEVRISEDETVTVPKYLKDEIRYSKQAINDERRELRENLIPDFDELSPVKRASVMANRDFAEIPIEPDEPGEEADDYIEDYFSGDDLEELWWQEYPNVADYMDKYYAVWEEVGGGDEEGLREILDRFVAEDPESLAKIFASGDPRLEIEYIYPSKPLSGNGSKRGYKYNRLSAFQDPYEKRRNNVIEFWREMESEYLD